MFRFIYISLIAFLFFSCKKYSQPSEPKIQGQWLISRIDFYRIEYEDTIKEYHYYPGDVFVLPNENSPLDSVLVGNTYFACSGVEICFNPLFVYGGATDYQNKYFYSISEVNYDYPGFLSFSTEKRGNVCKIISSEYISGLFLQLKGQWNPNAGFVKKSIIGYGGQRASKYDAIYMQCTRIGP
jgi:hypothetical protein